MSENTHAKSASELLTVNRNGPSYIDPNTLGLMTAQTEATLALAYEQRTANLIEFERGQWQAWNDGALDDEGKRLWDKAASQIAERLDLL